MLMLYRQPICACRVDNSLDQSKNEWYLFMALFVSLSPELVVLTVGDEILSQEFVLH